MPLALASVAAGILALAPLASVAGDVLLVSGSGGAVPEDVARAQPSLVLSLGGATPAAGVPQGAPRHLLGGEGRASGDLVRSIEAARVVHLAGGDVLDWWRALEPGGHEGGVLKALRHAHRSGTVVVGHGGAARYLAALALAPREELGPSRNPKRPDPGVVPVRGLGLAPELLVDLEGSAGGGLERTLLAQRVAGIDRALVLAGEVAWRWSPERGRATVHGSGSVLLVDLARARRTRDGFDGARLALLRDGDAWELRRRQALLAGRDLERTGGSARAELPGGLAAGPFAEALERIGRTGVPGTVSLASGEVRLVLRMTPDSRARRGPAGRLRLAEVGLGASGMPRDPVPVR